MCGIMGFVGSRPATPIVIAGLRKLGYRGYDSVGVATLGVHGDIRVSKHPGKIEGLEHLLKEFPLIGNIAIGHNRWATHGKVNYQNAHPHVAGKVAVVHNGIIENYAELKSWLVSEGCEFVSETDTEVIPHLVNFYLKKGLEPIEAILTSAGRLQGDLAIGIMLKGEKDHLFAFRRGQPIVIGIGQQGSVIASDEIALAGVAESLIELKNDEVAEIRNHEVAIWDSNGKLVEREACHVSLKESDVSRGEYEHFMLKEIYDQPETVRRTLDSLDEEPSLPTFRHVNRIPIVGCGTAHNAGLVAEEWFRQYAGIPVDCKVASEFSCEATVSFSKRVGIAISQSGETKDSLIALEEMRKAGISTLAVVNAPRSSMSKFADRTVYTKAYPEIAVASTKAFTAQLAVLAKLAVSEAKNRGVILEVDNIFSELPELLKKVLALEEKIKEISKIFEKVDSTYFIGRGLSYPLAREGALKMKEISYVHAEAYPCGELKHGALALVNKNLPTVAIAPSDDLFYKAASNIGEIVSHEGPVVLFSDKEGCEYLASKVLATLELPDFHPLSFPFTCSVALQLLAYHVGLLRGVNVDQPRNLAKSVTVE